MTSEFTRAVRSVLTAAALALTLAPLPAGAQEQGVADRGVQLGPLRVEPTIAWRTEYDDNVYRKTLQPISDIASTIGGSTTVRGQVRRLGLTASGGADWAHYSKLASERGASVETSLRVDFLSNRVVPYGSVSYGNTRRRINPEIDTRPRTKHLEAGAGGKIQLGGLTSLDLSASRTRITYDRFHVTEDGLLYQALNRETDQVTLSLLRQLTPLTRLTFTGETERALFETSRFRDARHTHVSAGFESEGRFKGHGRVGVRFLRLVHPMPLESSGLFVSVGTSLTVLDRLQIGVDADRDAVPSYRTGVAYYESYGYGTSITVAIRRAVRISAEAGRRLADYRDVDLSGFQSTERAGTDSEMRYGSSIRFLLGDQMSIDFTGLYTDRTSALATRQFDGLSLRAGVTHAF